MNLRSILFFSLLLSLFGLRSQDLIYLTNGTKFQGIVKEISPTELKYKSLNNPDGPTYVVAKNTVLFIEYKNGTVDVINKNPQPVSPQQETVVPKKEVKKNPNEMYYLNKNSIMINGLALTNADITLLYDREFAKSHLSVTLLGGYNFNVTTTWENLYISELLVEPKKHYDVGFGINFYPSTRRKAQYFVGLMMKYMNYTYKREVETEQIINGFSYVSSTYVPAESYEIATMIVNGLQVRISPFLNYKLFAGIGAYPLQGDLRRAWEEKNGTGNYSNNNSSNGSSSSQNYTPNNIPKIYLGMCFGYRF
jgi:hypothetical protein